MSEVGSENGQNTTPGTLSFTGNVANAEDQKIQSAMIFYVAGKEALEIYNTFTWTKMATIKMYTR